MADVLTLDGWLIEPSDDCRHKDWNENTSFDDEPDCPIPPGGYDDYLKMLPEDTVLVRVYCRG